jgi:hypothetical protein
MRRSFGIPPALPMRRISRLCRRRPRRHLKRQFTAKRRPTWSSGDRDHEDEQQQQAVHGELGGGGSNVPRCEKNILIAPDKTSHRLT